MAQPRTRDHDPGTEVIARIARITGVTTSVVTLAFAGVALVAIAITLILSLL